MKTIVSIIAIIALISGVVYSSDPISELGYTEFTLITVRGIEGAIIPTKRLTLWDGGPRGIEGFLGLKDTVSGFWTPEIEDIKKTEASLKTHFESNNVDRFSYILSQYDEYKRQYFGLIIDGNRVVYINSFPADIQMEYTINYIMVDGGYCSFWRVMYWIDDNKFSGLETNSIY